MKVQSSGSENHLVAYSIMQPSNGTFVVFLFLYKNHSVIIGLLCIYT